MPTTVDAAQRELRLTVVCSRPGVDAIAKELGLAVSDDEAAAILEHIDREVDSVAQAAAAAATDARIAALVEIVRSAHAGPVRRNSECVRWPRRLSMC